MPLFLDLFIEELRKNKEEIKRCIDPLNACSELYIEVFNEHWNPVKVEGEIEGNVVAIDSSGRPVELRNGTVIYIARSMSLSNKGIKRRKLAVKAFFSPTNSNDYNTFMARVMEHLEHLVALDVLRNDDPDVILIDGSLYGRVVHMPRDTNIQGHNSFMVDYIDTYFRLLNEAHERNVLVIGVSKDSSFRKLRELLLTESFLKALDSLNIPSETRRLLVNKWRHALAGAKEVRSLIREMEKILNVSSLSLREYLVEAANLGPDFHLLYKVTREEGFTDPFILGAPEREIEKLRRFEEYILRNFGKSLQESSDDLMYYRIIDVLIKALKYPAIVTFYYVPDKKDIPLRIDVPSHFLGIDTKVSEVTPSFVPDVKEKIVDIVKILKGLYGGSRRYNVLLSEVDSLVKMSNKDLMNVYEPLIAKELGILIEHTRDLRRVVYP